jgi:hypothetical protein
MKVGMNVGMNVGMKVGMNVSMNNDQLFCNDKAAVRRPVFTISF